MSTQLQIRGLRVELGGRAIIENLSFTAPTGSFIVLMGASGSGKSTLLRALAGLNPCTAEELRLGSTDLRPLPPAKRGVAMVFQDHALFPHLSVEQNLVFGLRARGVGATESAARAKRVAAELGISALLPRRVPGLSGGERQRVALGRALLREAPLVLMDEPLSSLDAPLRAKMRQDILRLHRQRGWTTVYVTHDPVEALAMADWLGLIEQGQLLQFAPPRQVYHHPASLQAAAYLGQPPMQCLPLVREGGQAHLLGAAITPPQDGGLIAGIRPEDLHCPALETDSLRWQAQLAGREWQGDMQILRLRVGAQELLCKVGSGFTPPADGLLTLGAEAEALRWFAADSGRALAR